jgi:hypothetical protein
LPGIILALTGDNHRWLPLLGEHAEPQWVACPLGLRNDKILSIVFILRVI